MIERRAIVTGATSGIGKAYAQILAERGWAIVAVARDEQRLREVVDSLPAEGHEVLPADLSTIEGVDRVISRLGNESAPISLLVNAAGAGTSAPYPSASLDEEVMMLRVNVEAVLRLSHAAARVMERRGVGAIINVSSTAAYWSAGTYAASKSWVLLTSLGLRASLAGSGVRVMTVAPGFTRTEFHARSSTDASGVKPWLWLRPEDVVVESLSALARNHPVCIPGRKYKVLVELVRHLPPGGRRAILRRLAPLTSSTPSD